jgi:hypothetical protein
MQRVDADLGAGDRGHQIERRGAYFLVGSWPAASMFSTRGSGPTCIGLP